MFVLVVINCTIYEKCYTNNYFPLKTDFGFALNDLDWPREQKILGTLILNYKSAIIYLIANIRHDICTRYSFSLMWPSVIKISNNHLLSTPKTRKKIKNYGPSWDLNP